MKLTTLCLLSALLAAAAPLSATTIATDGTYHEFLFASAGSFATSCGGGCVGTVNPVAEETSAAPWTFTGSASVFVLDLFNEGDEFELFDNNVLVGATSTVPNTGTNACFNDISCAKANSAYSEGTFALGAGAHSLTIEVLRNATTSNSGAAVFSASAATTTTPEPGSLLLTGSGLSFLGWMRSRYAVRKRRN